MKPIIFNTEMVRAILDGRKTCTRRVVKHGDRTPLSTCRPKLYKMVEELNGKPYFGAGFYRDTDVFFVDGKQHIDARYFRAPYRPGDILYVRECWSIAPDILRETPGPVYRADFTDAELDRLQSKHFRWKPSIHMPKEAARLFLRVTDVRVERLQEITEEGARAEGVRDPYDYQAPKWYDRNGLGKNYSCDAFVGLWASTIRKADLPNYGWDANPWVWVIEFERMEGTEDGRPETKAL